MKSILILTSGQPSTNPRLVKEADALANAGYKVTVLYQYRVDWAAQLDIPILNTSKWIAICIGGSPRSNSFIYWKSRVMHKAAKLFVKWFGLKNKISEQALGRCTFILMRKAKKIKADLYIAHNLAALPAAVLAAKKNKTKCGFDAEDYHRNETSDTKSNPDVLLHTYIEDKYFPLLDYLTTASPLISLAYKDLYPTLIPLTLLNVFPKHSINEQKISKNNSLRLFWFSQTIGFNRGLETVIDAIASLKEHKIELHLLGDVDVTVKNRFAERLTVKGLKQNVIFYYPPIPASEIFSFASQFDIGLATELSSPRNRDICLTNKIFTYIQSGLAILVSATSAQKKLMEEYPGMGLVYETNQLVDQLAIYVQNRALLNTHKRTAYNYATENLNWETEKEKLLSIIKQLIN